jgi:hypothetical protein
MPASPQEIIIETDQPARGWKRMRQLRAQDEANRKALVAELLSGLNRVPIALDHLAATNLAALHTRATRLESQGRDATEVRRLILQGMRTAVSSLRRPRHRHHLRSRRRLQRAARRANEGRGIRTPRRQRRRQRGPAKPLTRWRHERILGQLSLRRLPLERALAESFASTDSSG